VLYPVLAVIAGSIIACAHSTACGFPLYVSEISHVSGSFVTSSTLLSLSYVAVYVFPSAFVCAYKSTSSSPGILIITFNHVPFIFVLSSAHVDHHNTIGVLLSAMISGNVIYASHDHIYGSVLYNVGILHPLNELSSVYVFQL
jgi:hypothetical protein